MRQDAATQRGQKNTEYLRVRTALTRSYTVCQEPAGMKSIRVEHTCLTPYSISLTSSRHAPRIMRNTRFIAQAQSTRTQAHTHEHKPKAHEHKHTHTTMAQFSFTTPPVVRGTCVKGEGGREAHTLNKLPSFRRTAVSFC